MTATQPTILLVEDNDAKRYVVSSLLRQEGFAVQEATTGQEALRLAAEQPALILLDVKLPDMSGIEVCRRLKANPLTAAVSVLQFSAGYAQPEDKVMGLGSGAEGYLAGDADPKVLVALIKAKLRAQEALRESETYYRLLFEQHPTPIWVFDAETLQILAVNQAAIQHFGYTREEFLALSILDLRPPEEIPVTLSQYQVTTDSKSVWPGSH